MFAVLKTGGKQYRVQAGDVLRVELLDAKAGDKVQFNEILMVGGETVTVGAPLVAGAAVQAEVIDQIKADKVIHFVKRRRKHSSQRTKGHRQKLTLLRVTGVMADGADGSGVAAAVNTSHARRASHETGAAVAASAAVAPAAIATASADVLGASTAAAVATGAAVVAAAVTGVAVAAAAMTAATPDAGAPAKPKRAAKPAATKE